jgi:hypothetical protein
MNPECHHANWASEHYVQSITNKPYRSTGLSDGHLFARFGMAS